MEEEQIRELIARYLANQIDRSAFSVAFAGLYFQVRNNRRVSLKARRMCDAIVLPFAELSQGHRSEDSFRAELANAIRPFVSPVFEVRFLVAGPAGNNSASIFEMPNEDAMRQPSSVGSGNNSSYHVDQKPSGRTSFSYSESEAVA